MAELSSTSRNKKQTPRVDLTAMVDLAFLLITFFMLTTSLSKPIAMDIAKPDKSDNNNSIDLPASRSMTILLGKHNRVAWYMGVAGKSQPAIEDYHQIGQSIRRNKRLLAAANKKSLIVIIKPTSGASYQNFVDIMDELNIARITTAPAIDDDHITDAEKNFMKQNRIL
ncbi:MAG TPA: biopolymer transporter ExbD [Pedobacter sp.]|jgi:biopolymer transport protein ExbD